MNFREKFFWWKIGALTHDPPHKAWIIAKKVNWYTGIEGELQDVIREKRLKGHAAAAYAIRASIFSKEVVEKYLYNSAENLIHEADRLASAFDRWQISEVEKLSKKLFNVEEVYILNPLSGDVMYPEIPACIGLKKFMETLRELRGVQDTKLKYHIFYAMYEPIFYDKVTRISSPADRRSPTHTVFDHLYACASIVNWLCADAKSMDENLKNKGECEGGLEPRGLFVRIEFVNVQDFMSRSRKLRDIWFSSWFASALMFRILEKLIEDVGPDILIRPIARHNPFYYHMLLSRIEKDKNIPENVKDELKRIAEKYAGLKEWPKHAVIPNVVDILLPPYEVLSELLDEHEEIREDEDFVQYLYKEYIDTWKELIKAIRERVGKLAKEWGKLGNKLKNAVNELFQEYNIDESPPFIMHIAIVHVPEDLEEDERKNRVRYYDFAFKKLCELSKSIRTIEIDPACFTNLTDKTEKLWKDNKGYRMCSVCGKFPSVLDVPHNEKEYFNEVPDKLRVYFDPGEHLCPYCLIKRLATHPAIFKRIAEVLIESEKVVPLRFPSVSSVATYPFMKGLVKAQNDDKVNKILGEIVEDLKSKGKIEKVRTDYWDALEQLKKESNPLMKKLLGYDAEQFLLPEDAKNREKVENLVKNVKKVVGDILDPTFVRVNTYYAIVRAGGDYIESLFNGKLDLETIGENYIELLVRSMERIPDPKMIELARLIKESANSNVKVVKRILLSELGKDADERGSDVKKTAETLCKLFSGVYSKGMIPVTPAYHAMLSRALMITALKDIDTVCKDAKGVVIYAGNGGFLAIVPAAFALKLVLKTRMHYSIGDPGYRGFYKVGEGLFMSLGKASRSYSVVFVHYKYPMGYAMRLSRDFLSSAKEVQILRMSSCKSKDALLLAYCTRGGVKNKAILPLSSEEPLRILLSFIDSIENDLFSHSLPYSLIEEIRKYEKVCTLMTPEVFEKILSYDLKRNLLINEAEHVAEHLSLKLRELMHFTVLNGEKNEEPLLLHVMLALRVVMAALRGREL